MLTSSGTEELVSIPLEGRAPISRLVHSPQNVSACLILAHGAGAGMRHAFLNSAATGLAERGIATLRYRFPYMEQGLKRPDSPPVCHLAARSAATVAAQRFPKLPLFAGGKSFGGRMTSQAQAAAPLPGIRGLVFFGFPLHPPRSPSQERGKHLAQVQIPMLFLQGTRDALASMDLIQPLVKQLGRRATLKVVPDADHSFHIPARSGRKDDGILSQMLDWVAEWTRTVAH